MPEDKPVTEATDKVVVNQPEVTTTETVNTELKKSQEVTKPEVTLEPWQQRLLDEQSELEERIRKAFDFAVTLDRDSIDYRQLQNQIEAMRGYYQALGLRVERLVLKQ